MIARICIIELLLEFVKIVDTEGFSISVTSISTVCSCSLFSISDCFHTIDANTSFDFVQYLIQFSVRVILEMDEGQCLC